MPRPIQELYAANQQNNVPLLRSRELRHYESLFWSVIRSTSNSPETYSSEPTLISYLEALPFEQRCKYHKALSHLPPAQVADEYGLEVLLWTHLDLSSQDSEMKNQRRQELQQRGIHTNHYENARRWANFCGYHDDYSFVLAQYHVTEALTGGLLDIIDLPEIVYAAPQPGVRLSEKRVGKYSLRPFEPDEDYNCAGWEAKDWYGQNHNGLMYKVWLDAPVAIGLWYGERPIALAGISAAAEDIMMINQLQPIFAIKGGKYNRPSALMPIYWQKVLVEASEAAASLLGFKYISIQGGANNLWIRDGHLTKKEAHNRYDAKAKLFGYEKHRNDGNWYKPVPTYPC